MAYLCPCRLIRLTCCATHLQTQQHRAAAAKAAQQAAAQHGVWPLPRTSQQQQQAPSLQLDWSTPAAVEAAAAEGERGSPEGHSSLSQLLLKLQQQKQQQVRRAPNVICQFIGCTLSVVTMTGCASRDP